LISSPLLHRQKWKKQNPKCTWIAHPGQGGVFGKNYTNVVLQELNEILGVDNPERHTAHAYRKMGASALVNQPGVGPKLAKNLSRHMRFDTLCEYEKPDVAAMDRATEALLGKSKLESASAVQKNSTFEVQHLRHAASESPQESSFGGSFNNSPIPQQSFASTPSSNAVSTNACGNLGFLTQTNMERNPRTRSSQGPSGFSISFNNQPSPPASDYCTPRQSNMQSSWIEGSFCDENAYPNHSNGPGGYSNHSNGPGGYSNHSNGPGGYSNHSNRPTGGYSNHSNGPPGPSM
jgi:hypothetical protein